MGHENRIGCQGYNLRINILVKHYEELKTFEKLKPENKKIVQGPDYIMDNNFQNFVGIIKSILKIEHIGMSLLLCCSNFIMKK